MRVKRNNIVAVRVFTGRDLIEKLYSEGLWKSVERFFKGKKVVNNEKNASENAIKLLKESGASENELKLAKESLDKSLESYKEEHKMYYKSPFINKLQSFRKNKEK